MSHSTRCYMPKLKASAVPCFPWNLQEASAELLVVADNPRYSLFVRIHSSLWCCPLMTIFLCLYISSYKVTGQTELRTYAISVWPHLKVTHYIYYDFISKWNHILMYWGLRLQVNIFGDTVQPIKMDDRKCINSLIYWWVFLKQSDTCTESLE